jgi:hypothetical protein
MQNTKHNKKHITPEILHVNPMQEKTTKQLSLCSSTRTNLQFTIFNLDRHPPVTNEDTNPLKHQPVTDNEDTNPLKHQLDANEDTNPLRHQPITNNEDTNPLRHQSIADNEDTNTL